MRRLHAVTMSAVMSAAILFSAGSVLAQQPNGESHQSEQQISQRDPEAGQSPRLVTQEPFGTNNPDNGDTDTAIENHKIHDRPKTEYRGVMEAAPIEAIHSSALIEAEVKTSVNDISGSVKDLIIDENGQVIALVIKLFDDQHLVDKDIAIGWDDVKRSATTGNQHLSIKFSREDLESAAAFKRRE